MVFGYPEIPETTHVLYKKDGYYYCTICGKLQKIEERDEIIKGIVEEFLGQDEMPEYDYVARVAEWFNAQGC